MRSECAYVCAMLAREHIWNNCCCGSALAWEGSKSKFALGIKALALCRHKSLRQKTCTSVGGELFEGLPRHAVDVVVVIVLPLPQWVIFEYRLSNLFSTTKIAVSSGGGHDTSASKGGRNIYGFGLHNIFLLLFPLLSLSVSPSLWLLV